MSETVCERVQMAAMAIEDGHSPQMPVEEVESHLAACAGCRGEIEQMKSVIELVSRQRRRELRADLWGRVERGVEAAPREPDGREKAERRGWRVLLITALLLVGSKVAQLGVGREPGLALKLAPLLIAIALFAFLRENPFKIKMELEPERE